jgi:hypothetical protein
VKYIPEWIPGAGFKRKARVWGKGMLDMCTTPFNDTYKSFVSRTCTATLFIR